MTTTTCGFCKIKLCKINCTKEHDCKTRITYNIKVNETIDGELITCQERKCKIHWLMQIMGNKTIGCSCCGEHKTGIYNSLFYWLRTIDGNGNWIIYQVCSYP